MTYASDRPSILQILPSSKRARSTPPPFAYDELSDLATLRLSNDPLLIEGVVTQPYTPAVTWTFDERRVVWVQVKDSVGNWSEPYPAYAAQATRPERKLYLPLVLK